MVAGSMLEQGVESLQGRLLTQQRKPLAAQIFTSKELELRVLDRSILASEEISGSPAEGSP